MTTIAEIQGLVRHAVLMRTSLRIVGAGTWLTAGQPVRDDAQKLSLADLAGIVEYVPGDLTLTARAGTPLSVIDAAARAESQWLPLDPLGSPDGTIGATIATGSYGPLARVYGMPRDIVLGLEVVTGEGEIIRTGGRVVKNVAGFDLTRLMTGAWGTLGVLTEVTVRLRARPEVGVTPATPHDAIPHDDRVTWHRRPHHPHDRGPAYDRLVRGVKQAFDPHHVLNPGIMGEAHHT